MRQPDGWQSGEIPLRSDARLPIEPNAWIEYRVHRPSDLENRTTKAPLAPASTTFEERTPALR
jgi:hypothetical protein